MADLNIWLIQTGEPLPLSENVRKMRTGLLADSLTGRGHNVLWFTSAFDHIKKKWIFNCDKEIDLSSRLRIRAIKGLGYRKNISLSRFIDHRIIARKFRKLAMQMEKPDIIIASMPPHDLCYEAVMYARRNNVPVLVDIRDPWPDIFLSHVPGIFRPLVSAVLYRDFRMIKKTMQLTDGITAVTNLFFNWGLKYAGREKSKKDRLFYFGYRKRQGIINGSIEDKWRGLSENLRNKFIVFYVGTISRSYHNPLILVRTAERLSENKDIHFVIAGDGEFFEKLKRASRNLANITLTGWLNEHDIAFWLGLSKIGVCPVTKHIDLPTNKAYTYLSAGLPIISAFQGDMKMIIEKCQIGFYYPPNDIDSFVECILKLYSNSDLHKKMSDSAMRIFYEMFDADKIYTDYAEHVEMVVEDCRKSRI